MPWNLAKEDLQKPVLDAVLYHLCEGMRFVSLMVEPVIPIAAEKIWTQLGLNDFKEKTYADLSWGGIEEGTKVHKGDPIFPRIELDKEPDESEKVVVKQKEISPQITIDDFFKTDLRVAEILTAEKVEKSKKLLHYLTFAPAGISTNGTTNLPSFDAARIIPCDSIPINFAGFKFETKMTCLPINSPGS